jgi:hypothetical protein
MRVRWKAVLVLAMLFWAPLGASDTPPPIHWTGDHWSAWNPPVIPPGATDVHVVLRGDTLWDLATKYLGNPYLWPQIWEKNQYVLDAHWIYPGDPLWVRIEALPVAPAELLADESGAGNAAGSAEEGDADAAAPVGGTGDGLDILPADAAGPPQALGFEGDIACSGFIDTEGDTPSLRIKASEHEAYSPDLKGRADRRNTRGRWGKTSVVKYGLDLGDIVYLDGDGFATLSPGTILMAVETREKVVHPVTGEPMGRFNAFLGQVRVLSVQGSAAIAEIVQACTAIPVGSRLRAYEAEPIPLGRRGQPRSINDPPAEEALAQAPAIIYAKDRVISLGEDHVVFIDRGSEQNVTPGDVFTVYRLNRPDLPAVPVGELAVLSVRAKTSVARILQSRLPIYIGDRLERR